MKIMILGAGVYQYPLIAKAKEMGHEVLVVSPQGNYPGLSIADILIDCDTRDKEAVLKAALEYKIDGIATTGTDVAVPSIGYVVDKLNLTGTGYNAALKSMNKAQMKKCFFEHDVQTAAFKLVKSLAEIQSVANEVGYPLMVKAVDSSGSRGITKVDCKEDLYAAYEEARAVTSSDEVIVEQFLSGFEIGAQAIVSGDEVVDIFLHSDIVTPPPVSVPVGHSMPLIVSEAVSKKTKQIIKKAVKALGISNTVSNVDIMIVDDEPYILEIGARMGATCLPENISIYNNFDVYEYLINLALGSQPQLLVNEQKQPNAALLLCSNKTGIVKEINIPDEIKHHPSLIDIALDVKEGDSVQKFHVGPDRIGQIITIGNSETEAVKLAEDLASRIQVVVE